MSSSTAPLPMSAESVATPAAAAVAPLGCVTALSPMPLMHPAARSGEAHLGHHDTHPWS